MTTTPDHSTKPRPQPESRNSLLEQPVDDDLATLADRGEIGGLLVPDWEEQLARGYGYTLREIGRQPNVWPEARPQMLEVEPRGLVERAGRASGDTPP